MKHCIRFEVSLKKGHSDPEGETTADLLKELGYKVEAISVGKVYRVILEAPSRREAQAEAVEMCKRLLANPTKDDYSISFEETR